MRDSPPASAITRGTAAIEAIDLVKTFRTGQDVVHAVRGISLNVRKGEIVALEGPSGSGKTTLLCILGCMLTQDTGRLLIDGREVDPTRPKLLPKLRRESIGFVFQQFNLFPALNVRENILYALKIKGIRGAKARHETSRMIEAVGLGSRERARPRELSGGQKQRVAIARALAGSSQVVLADEPTANLDVHTGSQILDIFRELARRENRAVVIVTHDAKVRRIADRVCSIQDGRLTEQSHESAAATPSEPPKTNGVHAESKPLGPVRRLGCAIPNGRAFARIAAEVPTTNGRRSFSIPAAFPNEIALKTPTVNGDLRTSPPILPARPTPVPPVPTPTELTPALKPLERSKRVALPDPWCCTVIGSPALKGFASYCNGAFRLEASGPDDKADGDHFHTVDRMHKGDATIVARVELPSTTPAQAGLMIRATSDPASPFADIVVSHDDGVSFHWRAKAGGEVFGSHRTDCATPRPAWLKLVRAGETLTGYYSRDGMNYVEVGSATLALGKHVFIGLAATSDEPITIFQATFDHVTVSPPDPLAPPSVLAGCEASILTLPGSSSEELLVR